MGGCVALPYVSPPLKTEFNVGVGGGQQQLHEGQPAEGSRAQAVLGARVAIHPMGMVESHFHRNWDVGVGYVFESVVNADLDPPQFHGLYVDGSYWFVQEKLAEWTAWRFGVLVRGDLKWSVDSAETVGPGGGVYAGITFEYAGFVGFTPFESHSEETDAEGKTEAGGILGVAYGEGGVGASLVGGYQVIGEQRYWAVLVNLTFRLPASAGVIWKSL